MSATQTIRKRPKLSREAMYLIIRSPVTDCIQHASNERSADFRIPIKLEFSADSAHVSSTVLSY